MPQGRFISGRKSALAALLTGALALTACVEATQYGPATGRGQYATGYSDRQVEENRFLVSFAGNSVTSRETVERYLLFRAAELTVQNRGDYFILVERDTDRRTQTYVDRPINGGFGGGFYGSGFGYWGPSWRYSRRGYGWGAWGPYGGDPFFNDYQVRQVDRYEATAEIVIGRGPKPRDNVRAFDARQVIDRLGPTIETPR